MAVRPTYPNLPAGGADTVWTITASSQQDTLAVVSTTLQADGADTAPDSWALTKPSASSSSVSGSGHTVTYTPDVPGRYILEATIGSEIVARTVQVGDDDLYILQDLSTGSEFGQAALKGAAWSVGTSNTPCVAQNQHGAVDAGRDGVGQVVAVTRPAGAQRISVKVTGIGTLPVEFPNGASCICGPIVMDGTTLATASGYFAGVGRFNFSPDQERGLKVDVIGGTAANSAPNLDKTGPYESVMVVGFDGTGADSAMATARDPTGNEDATAQETAANGSFSTVYAGFHTGIVTAHDLADLSFGASVQVWTRWE